MTMPDVNCPECGGIYQLPAGTICKTCNRKHSPFIAMMQEQERESEIVTALREENERLREALRFYGDKNNSKKHDGYVLGNWIEINGVLLFDPDNGQRAREALGEKNDPQ